MRGWDPIPCLPRISATALKQLDFFLPTKVVAEVQLEPRDSAVLLGSEASFNCSLKDPWSVMTWLFNGRVALTISKDYGVLQNTTRFTAANYTTNEVYKWEFTIMNVTRNDSGVITCDVQNIQRRAHLSIQESGTVSIKGGNITVRPDEQVFFVCVASGWFPEPQVSWNINGKMADTENYNTTVETAGTLLNSNSTLSISAVESAEVQCLAKVPALFTPQTTSVFLIVDKTNLQPDRTWLIAIIVTFSLVALVVLVIIGIILFCKRKNANKSSSKGNVMNPSQNAEETHGKDNPGYITNGDRSHSNFITVNNYQIPDMNQTSSGQQNVSKIHEGMTTTTFRHVRGKKPLFLCETLTGGGPPLVLPPCKERQL
ncbi:immunoglobulin superfamily member 5 isoform X2 [Alosa sapidissima]|uniref:immunoglobulin superfamily member 5 isoform X2 n=1 Tax=Alosa sapidissima TaxID=34773 RepID=UPI001C0881AB|nr:immunoglobulin superfamily member 5 isoform X2 [Alosa sapidissima]